PPPLPWASGGEHRSPPFARWGELLWRRPYAFGGFALAALLLLALPVLSVRTGMPSIKVVPPDGHSRQGYEQIQAGFGTGAPGVLQVVVPASSVRQAMTAVQGDPGIAHALPPRTGGGKALV